MPTSNNSGVSLTNYTTITSNNNKASLTNYTTITSNNNEVSLKEIRETYYSLRNFEISNLWQRSIFLSAMLALFYSGYGYIVSKFLDEKVKDLLLRREVNEIQHNRLKYNNIAHSLLPVCALFAPLLENSRLFRAHCLHIVAAAASWFVASTRKHNAAPACAAQHTRRPNHAKGQTKTAPLSIKTKGRPFLCWLMFAVCMRDDGRQSLNQTRGRALCRTSSRRRTCP